MTSDPVRREAVVPDLAVITPAAPTGSPLPPAAVAVTGAVLLTALTLPLTRHRGPSGLDASLHRWVLQHRGGADLALARAVTWGGVTEVVVPGLLLVGTLAARGGWLRRLQTGLLVTCVASAGMYAGLLLNHAVGRVRPPVTDWAGTAGGPAFPSGHTTAATLFAAGCAWVLLDRFRAGRRRRAVAAAAVCWSAAVGWSRIWLGVHWTTDVVGGWLVAGTWSALCIVLLRRFRHRRDPGPPTPEEEP